MCVGDYDPPLLYVIMFIEKNKGMYTSGTLDNKLIYLYQGSQLNSSTTSIHNKS
jgi:hypothetical protein